MNEQNGMKGLILSGGRGSRMRPLTFTRAKQLIPIANKPNLFYVVEDLVASGITDIGVVICPETGDEIREALGDGSRWGARFTFILQREPLGLAHAVKTAREFLARAPFVMYLGDNLLSGGIAHLVHQYEQGQADSLVLLTPVERPEQFGVAVLDGQGKVTRLVEKPTHAPSNLALVGVYLFGPEIHEVIETLEPSARGEYEITDAIQGMMDKGLHVAARQVRGWWKDTGRPEDLLDANRLVLSHMARDVQGDIRNSTLTGDVVVQASASVSDSELRGPIHVAGGARIEGSYVGPYTSIGPGAHVLDSELEYSILFDHASIRSVPSRLDASVIGQNVTVNGNGTGSLRRTVRMILGDCGQVTL